MITADAVGVEGLSQLRHTLRAIDEKLPDRVKELNLRVADLVADAARARAPVGPHLGGPKGRSTPLRQSIRAYGRAGQAIIGAGGPRTPWGPVTEFGGKIPRRGRDASLAAKAKAGRRSYEGILTTPLTRVRAQPYLYPAIDATREQVVDLYNAGLDTLFALAFPD